MAGKGKSVRADDPEARSKMIVNDPLASRVALGPILQSYAGRRVTVAWVGGDRSRRTSKPARSPGRSVDAQ